MVIWSGGMWKCSKCVGDTLTLLYCPEVFMGLPRPEKLILPQTTTIIVDKPII